MEFFGFWLLGLALLFYFLPALIAKERKTQHSGAIFLINLVFGWTILGWIAALIWAIVEAPEPAAGAVGYDEATGLPVAPKSK